VWWGRPALLKRVWFSFHKVPRPRQPAGSLLGMKVWWVWLGGTYRRVQMMYGLAHCWVLRGYLEGFGFLFWLLLVLIV